MFIEESFWIRKTLNQLKPKSNNNEVANLGSSTHHFRTVIQPHIHTNLIGPLIKNCWHINNIDCKKDEGVDLIADVAFPEFAKGHTNKFALTICTNMLEHVENIPAVVNNLLTITITGGYILITVPYKYKLHYDPIDNGFRPKPSEIVSLFPHHSVKVIDSAVIIIHNKTYYQIKKSRFPLWGYRERIKYYLGIKHKVSGVLLQVL
ncbi:MAG: hypothetical protein ABJA79_01940 [Parafilimonas sp.]